MATDEDRNTKSHAPAADAAGLLKSERVDLGVELESVRAERDDLADKVEELTRTKETCWRNLNEARDDLAAVRAERDRLGRELDAALRRLR